MDTINIVLGLIFIIFFILTLSSGFLINNKKNKVKNSLWLLAAILAIIFLVCAILIFTSIDLEILHTDKNINNFFEKVPNDWTNIKKLNDTQNYEIQKNIKSLKVYDTLIQSNSNTIEYSQNTLSNTVGLIDNLQYTQGPQGQQGPIGASWDGSLVLTEAMTRTVTTEDIYIENEKIKFPQALTDYLSSNISYDDITGIWTLVPNALYEINYVVNCSYEPSADWRYTNFHIGNGSVSDTVYSTGWLDGYGTINRPTGSISSGTSSSVRTLTYSTYNNNPLTIYLTIHATSFGGCRVLKESRMTVIKLN